MFTPVLQILSNKLDELVVFCQKAGTECNFAQEHYTDFYNAEFNRCFTFDVFKGTNDIDEATSQGIRNGHTFIFMPGTAMIGHEDGSLLTIPGTQYMLSTVGSHLLNLIIL